MGKRYKSTVVYKIAVSIYVKLIDLWWYILAKWAYLCGGKDIYQKKGPIANILVKILGKNGVQAMSIVSNKGYVALSSLNTISIVNKNRKGTVVAQVYDINQTPTSLDDVPMEDLYVAKYDKVCIHGCSDIICDFDRGIIANDFAYSLNDRIICCSTNVIRKQYNRCALVRKGVYGGCLESGILITSAFAANYYHVLYEILIKVYLLNQLNLPRELPLIIDRSIGETPQLWEIFNLLNTEQRSIIRIDEDKYYNINNAYYLSSVNCVPQQIIKQNLVQLTDFAFDKDIFTDYRNFLLSFKSDETYPKRIFISRKGYTRRQYNEDELVEVVKRYGFEVVHPELLTFVQQMAMYNNAEIVIGATGASFANVLFMKKNTMAICLMSEKNVFPAFTIGSEISGNKLIYIVGEKKKIRANRYSFQADFKVAPRKLDEMLRKILQ